MARQWLHIFLNAQQSVVNGSESTGEYQKCSRIDAICKRVRFGLCRNWFRVNREMLETHTHTHTLLAVEKQGHQVTEIEYNEKLKGRRHEASAREISMTVDR